MKADLFVRGLKFGEGVRWHEGRFWYSDYFRHQVLSVAPDGGSRVEVEIDDQPSGLGWLPNGRLWRIEGQVGDRPRRRSALNVSAGRAPRLLQGISPNPT